jgi:AcrR family transcriptional regulator
MPKIRDEALHENYREQIKQLAREQMNEAGIDGISMRGIARAIDLTTPALYRYYESREALVIDLIADSYYAIADQLADALSSIPTDAAAERLLAITQTYRRWALDHPSDFLLIVTNGNSVPGQSAPPEEVFPAIREVFPLWASVIRAALIDPVPADDTLPASTRVQLAFVREQGDYGDISLYALYVAMALWAHLTGLLVLELFNQFQPVLGDPAPFFVFEVNKLLTTWGLPTA